MGMSRETREGDPARVCTYFFQNCFGDGTNPKYLFALLYAELCLTHCFERVIKWLKDAISGFLSTEL